MSQQRADKLFTKGMDHMKPSFFKNKSDRLEKAITCFSEASNLYYANGLYLDSSNAFRACAKAHLDNNNTYEAISNYSSSLRSLRKIDMFDEAITDIETIVNLSLPSGRLKSAAKHLEILAELDPINSIEHKRVAIDYYEKDDCFSNANRLKYGLANELALSDNSSEIQESISIYNNLAICYSENKNLIWDVPDCCFRSGLCYLKLGDMTHVWLNKYQNLYPIFANKYQCKFLQDVIETPDEFVNHVRNLDDHNTLCEWSTSMLLSIKQRLSTSLVEL